MPPLLRPTPSLVESKGGIDWSDAVIAAAKAQEAILNTMIAQAADRSGGCDGVTIAQLWGIKELLENEFTLAAALGDED